MKALGWILALVFVACFWATFCTSPTVPKKAFIVKAQTQVKAIETAIRNYEQDYDQLPLLPEDLEKTSELGGKVFLSNNDYGFFMAAITGDDPNSPEQASVILNTRGDIYLEPEYIGSGRGGIHPEDPNQQWNDPWGNPYVIIVDSDGDKSLIDPIDGETRLRKSILVLSAGPGHKAGTVKSLKDIDLKDDELVLSWR